MNEIVLEDLATSFAGIKNKLGELIELVNDKEDWDTFEEIQRNILASREMAVLVLTLLNAIFEATKDKEDFVATLATTLDKLVKVNGLLEIFDGIAFKMALSSVYDTIYGNEKVAKVAADIEAKVKQLLIMLETPDPVVEPEVTESTEVEAETVVEETPVVDEEEIPVVDEDDDSETLIDEKEFESFLLDDSDEKSE